MKAGNIIAPAAAGGLSFLAVRKNRKLNDTQKVLIVSGSALAGFLLYRVALSFAGTNVKKAPVDYGQIPTLPNGVKWDADPLAKEFAENFEGYNLYEYPETTDKLLKLQPDQVKLLYNHYNEYYAKDAPTLTKLIEGEWSYLTSGSYQKAVARLKSLGLNDSAAHFLSGVHCFPG